MPTNDLTNLISGRLGNRTRRSDVLQPVSFPGLSIDNVSTSPGVDGGTTATANGGASNVAQQTSELSRQLNDLRTSQQTQVERLLENTQALLGNTSAKTASSGSGTSGTIESLASSLLSGSGLGTLVQGIMSLFGGTGDTPQPLTPFNLPSSIQYAGAQTPGGIAPVDYGQDGKLRQVTASQDGAASSASKAGSTVQIQVNAMDSQSFLDHSDDIAQAVRRALLNSSSLKDVIAEL